LISKVKIFLACSFAPDDQDLVGHMQRLLTSKRFNFEVRTARSPEARGIGDKISELIDWADVTLGLFSRRFRDPDTGDWLPPFYVVSECSYALGRYLGNEAKGVYGLVEEGIKHSNLGLPTAAGAELPSFNRSEIGGDRLPPLLEAYFFDLNHRYGSQRASGPQAFLRQRQVLKTVEVYRSGCGVFKSTVEIFVSNPAQIAEQGNRVQHTIWLPQGQFPPFAEMTATSIRERTLRPIFSSVFIARGGKRLPQPMRAHLVNQEDRLITFQLEFPFKVKNNDVLTYHYLWSMPGAFHRFEEELGSEDAYDQVSLRVPFGKIGTARLRLKFERETVQGFSPPLFSKEPFVQFSISDTEQGLLLEPTAVSSLYEDATWEVYEWSSESLAHALVMRWRPVSRSTLNEVVEKSRFWRLASR
jgi:hypothetical protein